MLRESHQGTTLVAEFDLEKLRVEVTAPEGLRQFSGNWKLTEKTDSYFTLAVDLENDLGEPLQRELQFFYVPNAPASDPLAGKEASEAAGNSTAFVMPAPTSPELLDCNPIFYFSKLTPTDAPGLDVARAATGPELK